MSRWRPSPDEERWLEVASELGTAVPRATLAEPTGGWRSTGPLARAALFIFGFVAAVLFFGILGFDEATFLVAGLGAALLPGVGTGRLVTTVLLIALGIALLVAGLRRRRHAPMFGFMGCVACLAMELRLATTLANETWLIVYGLAALVAGVALDRYLRQPRNGLTSAALTKREGPLDLLQTAGAAVLAQRSAPEPPPAESTFKPGGGRFGGGGAGGSY